MIELEKKLDKIINLLENANQSVLDLDEACEYLKCKDTYLRGQIKQGKIRYKLKGRDYLFKREWLDDWMEI